MGKDVKELIKSVLEKSESFYEPKGTVSWRLPTGVPSLDKILGGGLPGGSIVQIYGPETSGKTTLAYHIAGQAVKEGLVTLFVALEKYSDNYAKACGIDTAADNYHVVGADFAEEIFNFCVESIRNYNVEVIVMDSITAAIPRKHIDKKQKVQKFDKEQQPGVQAKAVGLFIQQLQQPIRRKEALFITVNQLRSTIGMFGGGKAPTGGMALQYFSDIKLSLWGKEDRDKQLIESNITVKKGKDWDVVPFGATTLILHHARGVDINRDIISVCEKDGVVKKAGSWFSYIRPNGEEVKFQGAEKFSDALSLDSELREELYKIACNAEIKPKLSYPMMMM